ncbi:hypothetical protein [Bacillus sp. 1P06AnD]|uniref:hypothetical protein n=1 Tax=Bacillus sp. 1P06AnD TaxID=3132208 RepID=UPI0039A1A84B
MDKLGRRNTITVTFDQEHQQKKKKQEKTSERKAKAIIRPPEVEEIGSGESQEVPLASLSESGNTEEMFEWKLPQQVEEREDGNSGESIFSHSLQKKKIQRKGRNIQHFFIVVAIAVMIGAGFTYIALQTISTNGNAAKPIVAPLPEGAVTQSAGAKTITISPLDISVVQGDVFSDKERAEKSQQLFKSKEIPSIVFHNEDKYYVLLFASENLDRAKMVAGEYRKKGMDSYWKSFTLEAPSDKKINQADAKLLEASRALYRELNSSSTSMMLGEKAVNEAAVKEASAKLKEIEAKRQKPSDMGAALLKAAEVNDSGDSVKKALKVQGELLDFLLAYQSFIK